MPFIPVSNVAEAAMHYDADGQNCYNVYNYFKTSGWTLDDLNGLGEALTTWEDTIAQPWRGNGVTFVGVHLTDLTTASSPATDFIPSVPIVGGRVNFNLPLNVTVATTFITGLRGRSYRGRAYWIGITEDMTNYNNLTTDATVAIEAAYAALQALVIGTEEADLAIVSRVSDKTPRTVGVATQVIQVKTDNVLDSMRRRLPGRGR